jgi:hypothetical protein
MWGRGKLDARSYLTRMRDATVGTEHILPPLPNKHAGPLKGPGILFSRTGSEPEREQVQPSRPDA